MIWSSRTPPLGFFLLHATDGFDPVLPLLRRLGLRTRAENRPRELRAQGVRGDFDNVEPVDDIAEESPHAQRAIAAVAL